MKLALIVILSALPLAAAERNEKEQLVAEVLKLIDVPAITRAQFAAMRDDPEAREHVDRALSHVDFAKIEQEVYAPLFAKNFTVEELQQLVAFYRTKAGRKSIAILPDLGVNAIMAAGERVSDAMQKAEEEIEREKLKAHPELLAMSDLRTIATCLEARATDTDEYPQVTFDELPPLLEPTYVRKLPRVDPWGTPYAYLADGKHYRVVSAGADRRFEWDSRKLDLTEVSPRAMESLDADLIFQDGTFAQYPRTASAGSDRSIP
ncbi:MAG TPA: DUF2059 domain-containing protein [Thermoanaerobaculia bacterium]|nr:DUF2059 domain-containing protein [Thermoanaerobaculia bacterium]